MSEEWTWCARAVFASCWGGVSALLFLLSCFLSCWWSPACLGSAVRAGGSGGYL